MRDLVTRNFAIKLEIISLGEYQERQHITRFQSQVRKCNFVFMLLCHSQGDLMHYNN